LYRNFWDKGLMQFQIDEMKEKDWASVRSIYEEGIATGNATFETNVPEWEAWNNSHLKECRLVATDGGRVLGWAALSPVSRRYAYRGVADVSVYVTNQDRGRGVGKALLEALIEASEQQGVWSLQAVVFPENIASMALHKACGFREVGRREKIGKLHGQWRDVVLLERRSWNVGKDGW
jgi:L-amino acid N-acyltransferase YncA